MRPARVPLSHQVVQRPPDPGHRLVGHVLRGSCSRGRRRTLLFVIGNGGEQLVGGEAGPNPSYAEDMSLWRNDRYRWTTFDASVDT